jgi:hypothetical protein
MNDLENRLRESFQRQAEAPHAVAGLADTAVRRGRHTRQRRAVGGAVATSLVLAGGLYLGLTPSSSTVTPGVDPTATSGPVVAGAADQRWLLTLVEPATLHPYSYAAGSRLHENRHANRDARFVAGGKEQVVHQVTDVQGGWVVTFGPSDDVPATAFYDDEGKQQWSIPESSFSHAVDPTGTKVALSVRGQREVVSIGTGAVSDVLSFAKANDEGAPVAWTSAGVLVSAGDGGGGHADLWQPAAHTNRRITGAYQGARDMLGDQVALQVGDGLCVGISALATTGDRFFDCDHGDARFSPSGDRVVFWGQGSASVRRTSDGQVLRTALPQAGVLAAGWDGEAVIAVVRAQSEVANISVHVVRCTTDGAACEDLRAVNEDETAAVVAGVVGA